MKSSKNGKYKLYRSIFIRLIVLYVFIITFSYIILKEISTYKNNDLYITFFLNQFPGKELFTIKKEIVAFLLIINNISIVFFKENRIRLLALLKYLRKQINEIEEKSINYKKDNIIFGGTYDITFSEESLILTKKADFAIIKYENIAYILSIKNWLTNDNNICIITKDKQLFRLGDIIHITQFNKKLLEKNPKIIFEKSKNIDKDSLIDAKGINNILFKDIVTTLYKVFSKLLVIYTSLYYVINHNLLNNTISAHKIIIYIFSNLFIFLILCCIDYRISRVTVKRNT